MQYTNLEMESMLVVLEPMLTHHDMVGYVAARNVRTLTTNLTEYFAFKNELIRKHGVEEKDEEGNPTGRITLVPNTPEFEAFQREFEVIKDVKHDINLMTLKYEDIVGVLNGEEILKLDFILVD